jgi:hypothetical protein
MTSGINPFSTGSKTGVQTTQAAAPAAATTPELALADARNLYPLLVDQQSKVTQEMNSLGKLSTMISQGTFPPGMTREMAEAQRDAKTAQLLQDVQVLHEMSGRFNQDCNTVMSQGTDAQKLEVMKMMNWQTVGTTLGNQTSAMTNKIIGNMR